MNIAAYCRVSTKKDDQLNSLEVQKKFFEDYATKYGYNLTKIYADEGISGTKIKNRKEFLQMMQDSDKKMFDMVAVKDISRLARNAVDFLQGIRQLKDKGIVCNFVNSSLTSQDSEMVLGVLALVAQEESANTSKRIKSSKQTNALKGRVPSIVYGYDKIPGDYFNMTINKSEAQTIRRVYDLYVNENYGSSQIAGLLNKEGILTKRSCEWTQSSVMRLLKNPVYTGQIINGKVEIKDFLTGVRTAKNPEDWHIVQRDNLRIIDDELFGKAQDLLEKRVNDYKLDHKRQSNKHIFSTLIKCKSCGYSFQRVSREYVNTYNYWVCGGRNKRGAGTCMNNKTVREDELLAKIKDYLKDLLNKKQDYVEEAITAFKKIYKPKDEDILNEKSLGSKLNSLRINRNRVIEMYQDSMITRQEMNEKMNDLNSQITKMERDLQMVRKNTNKAAELESILYDSFQNIDDFLTGEMTNTKLKQIFDEITVDEEGNVELHLKLLSDIGYETTIPIGVNHTY